MKSTANSIRKPIPYVAWVALTCLVSAAIYLLWSSRAGEAGLPLDDAWIHQTYARNLAARGEWAFIPSQPSAGSTAPVWSMLLAVGQLLGPWAVLPWTYLFGIASLLGIGWVAEIMFRQATDWRHRAPLAGILLAGEWHLVWAALSGMETALMGLAALAVLALTLQKKPNWLWIGLAAGFSLWIRPDGLTLLGPAIWALWWAVEDPRKRWSGLAKLMGGFLIPAALYLLFNRLTNGSFWPNTFYAKQAEYAALLEQPIWTRLGQQLALPLVGVGVFLVIGFVAMAVWAWRGRQWAWIGTILWFLGYAGIYALRLPVTYQHGRYLIPAMPVFFLCGVIGLVKLWQVIPAGRFFFIFSRVFALSAGLVWLAFLGSGARAYADDVKMINTEMVAAAKWVQANTEPEALIAVHDIGAMGYFGERQIVDLAGLVTPEVAPFIREEIRLGDFLDEVGADYLVVFPDWYTSLPEGKKAFYSAPGGSEQMKDHPHMAVYRWKND